MRTSLGDLNERCHEFKSLPISKDESSGSTVRTWSFFLVHAIPCGSRQIDTQEVFSSTHPAIRDGKTDLETVGGGLYNGGELAHDGHGLVHMRNIGMYQYNTS